MKNHKIAIIDYGMGNLFSIASACQKVGLNPFISREKKIIMGCSAIILPGVGSFKEAMLRLDKYELNELIIDFYNTGKTVFGICLGMQLLFSKSFEFEETRGLNIIKGDVKKLIKDNTGKILKVPHTGWNTISKKSIDWNNSFLKNINENSFMYFVHSYFVIPMIKPYFRKQPMEEIIFVLQLIKEILSQLNFTLKKVVILAY